MDELLLVRIATGMLAYYQKFSSYEKGSEDQDEMQLASTFSALYHISNSLGNKDDIIIHQQVFINRN